MNGPGKENDFSKASAEMKIPSQLDNKDWGAVTKLVKRKVSNKERGNSGKFYGSRAILTKESTPFPTFISHLLSEADEASTLPELVIAEIKKNIKLGAKDLAQDWKDALELVHKAYKVANVRMPSPDEVGAWKQYVSLIQVGVKELARTRGVDGKWRQSTRLVNEAEAGSDSHIGKRRFFVEIPGERAVEVDSDSIDSIIEQVSNKLRRHGAKLRVDGRTKTAVALSVWVNDVKRDTITIKDIS